jgi:hypothetical protein
LVNQHFQFGFVFRAVEAFIETTGIIAGGFSWMALTIDTATLSSVL